MHLVYSEEKVHPAMMELVIWIGCETDPEVERILGAMCICMERRRMSGGKCRSRAKWIRCDSGMLS